MYNGPYLYDRKFIIVSIYQLIRYNCYIINFVSFSRRFRTITKILYHGNINIAIDIYNNNIIITIIYL